MGEEEKEQSKTDEGQEEPVQEQLKEREIDGHLIEGESLDNNYHPTVLTNDHVEGETEGEDEEREEIEEEDGEEIEEEDGKEIEEEEDEEDEEEEEKEQSKTDEGQEEPVQEQLKEREIDGHLIEGESLDN